jgi:hypothetical protein
MKVCWIGRRLTITKVAFDSRGAIAAKNSGDDQAHKAKYSYGKKEEMLIITVL